MATGASKAPPAAGRIRFRPLCVGDLAGFLAYRRDPIVARYQGWQPMTEAEALAFLAEHAGFKAPVPGEWSQLGVTRAGDDRLIGDAGLWLSPDGRSAEFGISLARHAQGQGYGTEAAAGLVAYLFASTGVDEVLAHSDERNRPCIGALTRAGMSGTGTRTASCKGELCTEVCFRTLGNET